MARNCAEFGDREHRKHSRQPTLELLAESSGFCLHGTTRSNLAWTRSRETPFEVDFAVRTGKSRMSAATESHEHREAQESEHCFWHARLTTRLVEALLSQFLYKFPELVAVWIWMLSGPGRFTSKPSSIFKQFHLPSSSNSSQGCVCFRRVSTETSPQSCCCIHPCCGIQPIDMPDPAPDDASCSSLPAPSDEPWVLPWAPLAITSARMRSMERASGEL